MNLRDQLFEAVKPFLMKEGIESSKEIIANNSTSFDEMGMASSNPGEFAPEEITDQENLVNTAKMANDNDFGTDEEGTETTVVSILGDDAMTNTGEVLEDLVRLGGDGVEEEEKTLSIGDMIESILRKKDKALLESLTEEDLEEDGFLSGNNINISPNASVSTGSIDMGFLGGTGSKDKNGDGENSSTSKQTDDNQQDMNQTEETLEEDDLDEMASYYPDFIPDNGRGGPSKAAQALVAWLNKRNATGDSSNLDDILSGRHVVPDDVKAKWPQALDLQQQYNISYLSSPIYKKSMENLAKKMANGNPEQAAMLLSSPTEEFCMQASDTLNKLLKDKIDFNFVPGEDILDTKNKWGGNYEARKAFEKAYAAEHPSKGVAALRDWLNPKEVANPLNLADEDIALLKQYNIKPDDPKAKAFLKVLKPKAKAKESVLAESDYAGNLSYNPDKRLNASDVLNAVKNAVKPELAAALSIVKNVDANEEPSYAIQNIDAKDLPATIEIDTNTDEKVVLKKDGNSYKFDK